MKKIKTINKEQCYFCGRTDHLQIHHIMNSADRKKSEEDGLCVWLCLWHHTGSPEAVHRNQEKKLHLKKVAQAIYEQEHSHEEWMQRYKRNYL